MSQPSLTPNQVAEYQTFVNERRTEYQRLTRARGPEIQLKALKRMREILAGVLPDSSGDGALLAIGRLKESVRQLEEIEQFVREYESTRELLEVAGRKS